jgi:hypothetical protein
MIIIMTIIYTFNLKLVVLGITYTVLADLKRPFLHLLKFLHNIKFKTV